MGKKMRVDKLLSNVGVASRAELKKYCKQGLISVNGKVINNPGVQVDSENDGFYFYIALLLLIIGIMRFNKKKEEYITDNGNVTDKLKIKCARKHFEALGEEVAFMAPESSPDEFMEKARAAMPEV